MTYGYRILLSIWIFLLLSAKALAGDQVEVQDLIRQADSLTFTNPQRAYELSLQAFELSESNDEKLSALFAALSASTSLRDTERSTQLAKQIEQLAMQSKNPYRVAKMYNVLGGQFHGLKLYNEGIEQLNKVDKLLKDEIENDAIRSVLGYNNLTKGFIYRDQLGCGVALPYMQEALGYYTRMQPEKWVRGNLSTLHYNMGNCYMRLGENDLASQSFENAIDHANEAGRASLLAFAQKGLADLYSNLGRHGEALHLLQDALDNAEAVGDKLLNQALHRSIAYNHLTLGDMDSYTKHINATKSIQYEIRQKNRSATIKIVADKTTEVEQMRSTERWQHQVFMFTVVLISLVLAIYTLLKVRKERREAAEITQRLKSLEHPQRQA